MIKPITPRRQRILPFDEWVEQHYPEKNKARAFLKMIGALDLAYLMYRMQSGKKQAKAVTAHAPKKPAIVPAMPLVVEEHVAPEEPVMELDTAIPEEVKEEKPAPKTHKPKKAAKSHAPKKTHAKKAPAEEPAPALAMEFDPKEEEAVMSTQETKTDAEPEPLELDNEKPEETPAPVASGELAWLGDERLEEDDLRKTDIGMGINGITVSFETEDVDDEAETRLTVDGVSYRMTLSNPPLNLSRMVQTARVSYGELYVLGRMALGAISGSGYIAADEAARIVHLLKEEGKTTDIEVTYFTKDKSSRNRSSGTLSVRFERV
jgi:hypothetical protein